MKSLIVLLTVLLLSTVTSPLRAADYSKPTTENLVHGYGAVFFNYAYSIENWVTYFDVKELRSQNEEKIKDAAHSIKIELAVDPTELTSKMDAMKTNIEYIKSGVKRAEELGYPYLMSCYSLGLASGVVHDNYANFGIYNSSDLPIPKAKLKNALHFLNRMRQHAKEVDVNKDLLKRLDDMIKTTKKASTSKQFRELALSLAKWYFDMYEFLLSTSFVPPPKR